MCLGSAGTSVLFCFLFVEINDSTFCFPLVPAERLFDFAVTVTLAECSLCFIQFMRRPAPGFTLSQLVSVLLPPLFLYCTLKINLLLQVTLCVTSLSLLTRWLLTFGFQQLTQSPALDERRFFYFFLHKTIVTNFTRAKYIYMFSPCE